MRFTHHILAIILTCLFTGQAFGAASLSPAFSTFTSAGGGSVNAGKQGTNTMQIVGASFSKPSGKPTMTIPTAASEITAANAGTPADSATFGFLDSVFKKLTWANVKSIIRGGVAYDTDYASLNAAVTAIGSTPRTLKITTDQTLTADLDIPTTLELMPLNGAQIVHGAYTVSYAGSTARWPLARIFDGTGLVQLHNAARIYTEWYGVKRDGVTEDSVEVQRAIDSASAYYMATGKPLSLHFVGGGSYVVKGVFLKPGVNLIGDGAAKFLKLPAGTETNEAVLKWWHMFATDSTSFNTDLACAHRILIQGIVFDGNLSNMNWTNNTYNQEQAHCLLLSGAASPTHLGQRAKYRVAQCKFQNSVADGVLQHRNSDVIFEDIEAENCFRGGLTLVGGNTRMVLRGYVGENARMDIEIDGTGYGGTYDTHVDIDGVVIDRNGGGVRPGGIDLGTVSGSKSILRARNVHAYTAPVNFAAGGDVFEIDNSYFTSGPQSTNNRLFYGRGKTRINAHFHVTNTNAGETTNYMGLEVIFEFGAQATETNRKVVFDRCTFSYDSVGLAGKSVYAIISPANVLSYDNSIEMVGCSVPSGFTSAVHFTQGGKLVWRGGYNDAKTAFHLLSSDITRNFELNVSGIEVGPNCTAWLQTNITGTANTRAVYRDVTIPVAASSVVNSTGTAAGLIASIVGQRNFQGTAPPVSGLWLLNDRINYTTATAGGVEGVICTTAGQAVKGAWTTGTAYVSGDYVSNASKCYIATTSGTSGATAPSHTTGTVSDGAVSWLYVSAYTAAVFKAFGSIAP